MNNDEIEMTFSSSTNPSQYKKSTTSVAKRTLH